MSGGAGARSSEVVVLGAGPAGLGVALRLARDGRSVVVLERAAVIGGLAGSFDVGGVRVDHGSHRLHPSTAPDVLAELHALLGDDLQRRERHGRLHLGGRFVEFPPRLADLAAHLPPRLGAALALDTVLAPFRRARDDTFAERARASLGPTLAREVHLPYARKLFGVEPRLLAGELARRRIGARSPRVLVGRALGVEPARRTFFYPRLGFGQIPDALATAAVGAGAEVSTSAEVTAVDVRDDEVVVRLSGGDEVRAGLLLSTLPLPLLARLAAAPSYVAEAAERLETRALTLVYLVLDRAPWTEFDAHYFPSPTVPMVRVSEPRNYRDSGDDPPGRTVLCAEVPCDVDDATWTAAPDALGAQVAAALAQAGLPPVEPVHVEVRRVPRAYPVYREGFAAHFEVLDGWVSRLGRVLTFGRQGLFAHDNTHHALAMAWAAADVVGARGAVDRGRWAAARRRFAEHVVED